MSKKAHRLSYLCVPAVLGALAIAAFGGCGSSGDSGSTSASGASTGTETSESGESTGTANGGSGGAGNSGSTGGASGGEAANAGGGTKAEFIKAADQICKEARKEIDAQLPNLLEGELTEESPGFVEEAVVPGVEKQIEEIQALETPAEATEASETLVVSFEEMIEEAEADPEAFVVEGKPAIKAQETAKKLGFKACGPV